MPVTTLRLEALLSLHGLVTVAALLTYVSLTRALHQRRYPSAAIGWVISLLLLPYVALPLFLLFGTRKLAQGSLPLSDADSRAAHDLPWPQALAASMRLAPAAHYGGLSIHADGAASLVALRRVIDTASRTLDVCTFILRGDAVGREIGDALIGKARAGVRVRLLLDGIGRWLAPPPDLRRLRAAGVEVAIFVPVIHSPLRGRLNLRNHRKMVIADNEWLWSGGRNLAGEYFDDGGKGWRDLTFDCAGPLVDSASALFARDWAFANGAPRAGAASTREERPNALRASDAAPDERRAKGHIAPGAGAVGSARHLTTEIDPPIPAVVSGSNHSQPLAQLVPTGPDQGDDTLLSMIVTAAFRARRRIVAVTPYFVPDESLLGALTLAARRGVVVDLLIPARSNHRMADIARHRALRDLDRAGGHVHLLPRMIHAKCLVADDTIAFAGSANLDARSLYLNYEMMIAFYAAADVQRFSAWIDAQRHDAATYVAHPPGLVRDMAEGLVLTLAFQM
jgi:cardiolipin synthase